MIAYGTPKSVHDIDLEDVLAHPIWVWSWDTGHEASRDNDAQVPVIGVDDVTATLSSPTITFRVKDTDVFASAEYDVDQKKIHSIAVWQKNEWVVLSDTDLKTPVVFVSIPKIEGREDVAFRCDSLEDDEAVIVHRPF